MIIIKGDRFHNGKELNHRRLRYSENEKTNKQSKTFNPSIIAYICTM